MLPNLMNGVKKMSIIKCPECGKDISDKSKSCIHCGFPISNSQNSRIFKTGTEIGYPCETCGLFNANFIVQNSNETKTEAICQGCGENVSIDFTKVVLTDDEYNLIDDDIYDNNLESAANKIISMIHCDYDTAYNFVLKCHQEWSDLEKRYNIPHHDDRTEILRKIELRNERQRLSQEYQYRNNAECPYCHSKSTKKISGLSKVGSVVLWGVFAVGKVGKQWHCNNCNSDF